MRCVWQKLLGRKSIDETQSSVTKGKINLHIGLLSLRHSTIEKRINGAKIVESIIRNAESSSFKSQLNSELVQILMKENILDLFFSNEYRHEALIKKSLAILKFLTK